MIIEIKDIVIIILDSFFLKNRKRFNSRVLKYSASIISFFTPLANLDFYIILLIYNVIHFLEKASRFKTIVASIKKTRRTAMLRIKNCRKIKCLISKKKVVANWTPNVIIGRAEKEIDCQMRTLYRRFKDSNMLTIKRHL